MGVAEGEKQRIKGKAIWLSEREVRLIRDFLAEVLFENNWHEEGSLIADVVKRAIQFALGPEREKFKRFY